MLCRRIASIAILLLLTISLNGCFFGRSKIVVSDGGSYDIYADESYVCSTGRGDCYLAKRGTSSPVHLKAVHKDVVAGETQISRSITVASVIWAPFTYYSSLFLYQAYPDEIYIYVGEPDENGSGAKWLSEQDDAPKESGSVWDKPLL